jgi:hypothetical protein
MEKALFHTPVLFIIYNRPDLTFKVFEAIQKVKPSRLYITADGPNTLKKDDEALCSQSRSVINRIDWDCALKVQMKKNNIGCKLHLSNAINWFFNNEEEGIILEDDTLPNESFFHYCAELLNYYRNDCTIGHIGGNFFNKDFPVLDGSYYYSKYPHVWGWATWRRAWKLYDVAVSTFPNTLINDSFNKYFNSGFEKYTFYNKFNQVYLNKKDTWYEQWLYTLWYNDMYSITPKFNLVSNLDFDKGTAHIKWRKNFANIPTRKLTAISHPVIKEPDFIADKLSYKLLFKRFILSSLFLLLRLTFYRLKYNDQTFKEYVKPATIPVSVK